MTDREPTHPLAGVLSYADLLEKYGWVPPRVRQPAPVWTPQDLCLLDVMTRTRITRLGQVVEAEVTRRDSTTYRVRLDGTAWACSCPAAVYGGRTGEPCKHAKALRLLRATLPAAFGGSA